MMKKHYVETSRTAKGPLWDEVEGVTDVHRKSLIRRMNGTCIASRIGDSEKRAMGQRSTMLCG